MITESEKTQNLKTEENNKIFESNILLKDNLIKCLKTQLKELNKKILEQECNAEEEVLKTQIRLNKDIQNTRKFSLERIIIDLLVISDSIESSLNLIKEHTENKIDDKILKKLKHIHNTLEEMFAYFNIKKINTINVSFNPDIHQAMSIHYDNEMPSNQVIKVMQSGYILHESRLLRPAMVIVSKKK